MDSGTVFLVIFGLFALWVIKTLISTRSDLIELSQEVKETRSNLAVAVQKKLQLVNQMIDVVKSYQQGEQLTHLRVSQDNATASVMAAYQQTSSVLTAIQSVAQRFPELKVGAQYGELTKSIQDCENQIQTKSEKLNAKIKRYNTYRSGLIAMVFANMLGYAEEPFLTFDHSDIGEPSRLARMQTEDNARVGNVLAQGVGVSVVAQAPAALPPPSVSAPARSLPASSRAPKGATVVFQGAPVLSLRFVAGPLNGQVLAVGPGMLLGREEPAELVVPDPQVSATHAWIGWRDGKATFIDQGSTNGSFLRGQRVAPGQLVELAGNEEIVLGGAGSVRFIVEVGQDHQMAGVRGGQELAS